MFSRKYFFRLFDGLLRISTTKTNAEPKCLTSLGGHDGAICVAKHLELVHAYHLANPLYGFDWLHLGKQILIKLVCHVLIKKKFGFIKRVDKGGITIVKDLESWRFER